MVQIWFQSYLKKSYYVFDQGLLPLLYLILLECFLPLLHSDLFDLYSLIVLVHLEHTVLFNSWLVDEELVKYSRLLFVGIISNSKFF